MMYCTCNTKEKHVMLHETVANEEGICIYCGYYAINHKVPFKGEPSYRYLFEKQIPRKYLGTTKKGVCHEKQ